MIVGNVNVLKVDDTPQYNLGDEFPMGGDKVAKYFKYNDGAGNTVGIQGMCAVTYGEATADTNVGTANEVTCDFNSADSADQFAGVVLAETITTGKYGWFQVSGLGHVPTWTDAGVAFREFMVPDIAGTNINGGWDTMADGEEEQVAAIALAADRTDDQMVELPTVAVDFAVGGTVTGGTSGAVATVKKIFKDGTTQKALYMTGLTATGTPFTKSEAITSNGGGSCTALDTEMVYYALRAGNYRIRGWR